MRKTLPFLLGIFLFCIPYQVQSEDIAWKIQSDTLNTENPYTICTPQPSHPPSDTPSMKDNHSIIHTTSNPSTPTVVTPGDSGREQAQKRDFDNASFTRPCSSLQLIHLHEFSSTIEDFRIGDDTSFTQIVTADTFLTYDDTIPKQSVALDTNVQVYLNRGSTATTARCRDLTEGLANKDQKSLDCRFFDSGGDTIRRRYFYNNAGGRRLFDTGFLVSQGGHLTLYDYNRDTDLWTDDRIQDRIFFSPDSRYFLVSYSGIKGTTNELRRLKTGKKISSGGDLVSSQGVDANDQLIYQVTPNPQSRTRSLHILDQSFRKVHTLKNLAFDGRYNGRFDPVRNRFYLFRRNHLKSVNYRKHRNDTFPYPYENFIPETYHLDSEAGHLFLYGSRKKKGDSSLLSRNFSRYLMIFNLKTNTFFPFLYRFPKTIYDFDTLEEPDVRRLSSGLLAVQHPKRLEVYEMNFSESPRAR